MENKWQLKQITIAGFRGYHQPQTLDLAAPVVLLEGPQGAGKSSTVAAVEWALFGNEIAKGAIGIVERKDWEVRNLKAPEAKVELVLSNGSAELMVTRSDERKRNGSPFQWQLNGRSCTDEAELRAYLGISAKDYFSSVHLHQEVTRALLVEAPATRRDMLDRLLGLSDLRNLLDGIKQAKIKESPKAADEKFDKIEAELNAIVVNKRREFQSHKNAAAANGLGTSELNESGTARLCGDIRSRLESFAAKCAITLALPPAFAALPGQRSFSESASKALRTVRNAQPDLQRRNALLTRQTQLQTLQTSHALETGALQKLLTTRGEVENQFGKRRDIRLRVDSELAPKLQAAKKMRAEMNRRAGVIEEAIRYFEVAVTSTEPACPVCEKKVTDPAQLQTRLVDLMKSLKTEIGPISNHIQKAETEIASLEDRIKELDSLEQRINAQQEKTNKERSAIESFLGETIAEAQDPDTLLTAATERVAAELTDIQSQVEQSTEQLNEIEDRIKMLNELLKVLTLETEIDELLQITESAEYKAVKEAKLKLEQLAADVDQITAAIAETLRASAEQKLDSARQCFADNFKRLTNRPDFPEIRIDPENYEILAVRGGEQQTALTILNVGDLNCAALSVFLGLCSTPGLSHQLGFIILDDPSQSLDGAHKTNLVSLLKSLPQKKQVVVATSEADLAQAIMTASVRAKKHYRFEPWSDNQGSTPKPFQAR